LKAAKTENMTLKQLEKMRRCIIWRQIHYTNWAYQR